MVGLATFIIIFNSCKKADLQSPIDNVSDATNIARIKESVAKQVEENGGIPQIFTHKQHVLTQWVDKNRIPVTKEQIQNNFTSACNFDLPTQSDLVQYSRVYRCGSSGAGFPPGYLIQFEYLVSWNNNIVLDNGSNIYTSGFIDIVDGSSNVVQSISLDYTNANVEIVEIGPDGSHPGNYYFSVKFRSINNSDLVPAAYINDASYTVKVSAMFVTDCKTGGDPYSLFMLPASLFGFTGNSGDDPCERNEMAWPNFNSSTHKIEITGYNALSLSCGYGSPFIEPDLQQVQYSLDGGATWVNCSNLTASNTYGIYNTSYIRKADVAYSPTITAGTYDVTIRYRNWKYISSSPTNYPTPSGSDCHSVGDGSNTLESTYAYKYYKGVTL